MLIFHKGHTGTIHVYSVTVMTHVKALQAGHSSQGTSEPITPVIKIEHNCTYRLQYNGSHTPRTLLLDIFMSIIICMLLLHIPVALLYYLCPTLGNILPQITPKYFGSLGLPGGHSRISHDSSCILLDSRADP